MYLFQHYYLPYCENPNLNIKPEDSENEAKYQYASKEDLSFEELCTLFQTNFLDNAKLMVPYLTASIYRDFIYKQNNYWFPVFNITGVPSGGKSTAARAMAKVFGECEPDGINLEGGSTPTGIRRLMNSIQNVIIWINEYKNSLSPDRIGMLKGFADGSGKLTGKATSGNQTKMYIPRSACILSGQELPTVDSALFERCISVTFNKEFGNDPKAYDRMVELQNCGAFNSIVNQLTAYRPLIVEYYKFYLKMVKSAINKQLKDRNIRIEDRLVLNYATVVSPLKILVDKAGIQLPFEIDEVIEFAVKRIEFQIKALAAGNDVDKFFSVLQGLVGRDIHENIHFQINKEKDHFYLRLRAVHGFYSQAANRQGINPLDESTLKTYLEVNPYFIEKKDNVRFRNLKNPTSAFCFKLSMLQDSDLEFESASAGDRAEPEEKSDEENLFEAFQRFMQSHQPNQYYDLKGMVNKFNAMPGMEKAISLAKFNALAERFNQNSTIRIRHMGAESIFLENVVAPF